MSIRTVGRPGVLPPTCHPLFDIVLDVLRKVELDAGELGLQRRADLLGQFLLVDATGPRIERLERHEEFGIEEAGGIGAVVGTPTLRDDCNDLRITPYQPAHSVDITVRLLE